MTKRVGLLGRVLLVDELGPCLERVGEQLCCSHDGIRVHVQYAPGTLFHHPHTPNPIASIPAEKYNPEQRGVDVGDSYILQIPFHPDQSA